MVIKCECKEDDKPINMNFMTCERKKSLLPVWCNAIKGSYSIADPDSYKKKIRCNGKWKHGITSSICTKCSKKKNWGGRHNFCCICGLPYCKYHLLNKKLVFSNNNELNKLPKKNICEDCNLLLIRYGIIYSLTKKDRQHIIQFYNESNSIYKRWEIVTNNDHWQTTEINPFGPTLNGGGLFTSNNKNKTFADRQNEYNANLEKQFNGTSQNNKSKKSWFPFGNKTSTTEKTKSQTDPKGFANWKNAQKKKDEELQEGKILEQFEVLTKYLNRRQIEIDKYLHSKCTNIPEFSISYVDNIYNYLDNTYSEQWRKIKNFYDDLKNNKIGTQENQNIPEGSITPTSPVVQNPEDHVDKCKVLDNFTPEDDDEIALNKGDTVTIIDKRTSDNDGWWEGVNKNGKSGLFPANFCEVIQQINDDDWGNMFKGGTINTKHKTKRKKLKKHRTKRKKLKKRRTKRKKRKTKRKRMYGGGIPYGGELKMLGNNIANNAVQNGVEKFTENIKNMLNNNTITCKIDKKNNTQSYPASIYKMKKGGGNKRRKTKSKKLRSKRNRTKHKKI